MYLRYPGDLLETECKTMDGAVIPDGGGAVLGWKHLEHVAWGVKQDHSSNTEGSYDLDDDLQAAAKFERDNTNEEIARYRQEEF